MALLRWLEGLRTPAGDAFFSAVTLLGEETFFTVVGLIIFWCVNKKWGLRFLLGGLLGSVFNQILKAIFIVPRPWVLDPTFTIVESAREAATGYSFPSGHTQSGVTVFGMLALWSKKRAAVIVCVIMALLVGFSRMYLGVHTPWDVGVSLCTGVLTVLGVHVLLSRWGEKTRGRIAISVGAVAFALVLLAVTTCLPVREGSIAEFDAHGVENAWKLLGTIVGFLIAWHWEETHTHFEVKAVWWAQVLKCVIGMALVVAVRAGFKPVLSALFGAQPFAGAIRYFAVAIVAGGLWPMTFGYFSKLGKR